MFEFQILRYEGPDDYEEVVVELNHEQVKPKHDSIVIPNSGLISLEFKSNGKTFGVLFSTELLCLINTQYLPVFSPPSQIEYLSDVVEAPRILVSNLKNDENPEDYFTNLSFELYEQYVALKYQNANNQRFYENRINSLEVDVIQLENEKNIQKCLKDDEINEYQIAQHKNSIVKNNMEIIVQDLELQRTRLEEALEKEKFSVKQFEKLSKVLIKECENIIEDKEKKEKELNRTVADLIKKIENLSTEKLGFETKAMNAEKEIQWLKQVVSIEKSVSSAQISAKSFYSGFKDYINSETIGTTENIIESYEDICNSLQEKLSLGFVEIQAKDEKITELAKTLTEMNSSLSDLKSLHSQKILKKKLKKQEILQEFEKQRKSFEIKLKKQKEKRKNLNERLTILSNENENLKASINKNLENYEEIVEKNKKFLCQQTLEFELQKNELEQQYLSKFIENQETIEKLKQSALEQKNWLENQLKESFAAYDSVVLEFNKQIFQETQKFEDQFAKNKELDSVLIISKETINELKEKNQANNEFISDLKNQVELLTILCSESSQSNEKLNEELKNQKSCYESLTKDNKNNLKEMQNFYDKIINADKQKNEESLSLLQLEIQALKSEIYKGECEKMSLNKKLEEVKDFILRITEDHENQKSGLNIIILENSQRYEYEINSLSQKCEFYQEMIENQKIEGEKQLNQEKDILVNEISSLKTEISGFHELIKKMTKENQEKIQELEEKTAADQEISKSEYNKSINDLTRHIEDLNQVIKSQEQQKEELNSFFLKFKESAESKEKFLREKFEYSINSLNSEKNSLKFELEAANKAKEEAVKNMKNITNSFEAKINSLTNDHKAQSASLENQINLLESSQISLLNQIEVKEKAFNDFKAIKDHEDIQQKLENDSNADKLSIKIQKLETDLKKIPELENCIEKQKFSLAESLQANKILQEKMTSLAVAFEKKEKTIEEKYEADVLAYNQEISKIKNEYQSQMTKQIELFSDKENNLKVENKLICSELINEIAQLKVSLQINAEKYNEKICEKEEIIKQQIESFEQQENKLKMNFEKEFSFLDSKIKALIAENLKNLTEKNAEIEKLENSTVSKQEVKRIKEEYEDKLQSIQNINKLLEMKGQNLIEEIEGFRERDRVVKENHQIQINEYQLIQNQLRIDLAQVSNTVLSQENELKNKNLLLTETTQHLSSYFSDYQDISLTHSDLQASSKILSEKCLSLSLEKKKLSTSLTSLQELFTKTSQKYKDLITTFNLNQETITKLKSENENLQEKIWKHSTELIKKEKECEDHLQALSDFTQKHLSLDETVQVLQETIHNKSKEIETLQNAILNTKAEKKQSNKELLNILSSHNPTDPETVDVMLNAYLVANNTCNHFIRIADGVYSHKNRKVGVCIRNGSLVIRVGGGYMYIDEFLKQYVDEVIEPGTPRRSYDGKKSGGVENNAEECVYDYSNPINGLANTSYSTKNSSKTPLKRFV